MNFRTALKTSLIVAATALSLAACGSSSSKGTTTTGGTTDGNTTGGTTGGTTGSAAKDPNASTMQNQSSSITASAAGGIQLPYVIYAPQAGASDANRTYAIEFLDFDPCYQGTEYGYSTVPADQTFSQLGFYFPAAVAAQTYNIGTGSGDIQTAYGALGTQFTKQGNDPNSTDPNKFVCSPTAWLQLQGGTVTINSVNGTTVSGTLNITLSDSSTVTGDFTTGSCTAVGSGAVLNPNGVACSTEK